MAKETNNKNKTGKEKTKTLDELLSELGAVILTQMAAIIITVYGLLMPAIGWKWAALVWGYCLVWFLIEDRIKLIGHRIFDKEHSGILTKKV